MCEISQESLQATRYAQNSQTAATVIASVGVSVSLLASLPQAATMGPTYFLMVHMQQLIRSIVLIGDIPNEYVSTFLCVKVSPFDFILLPDKWLPLDIKKDDQNKTTDKYY